MPPIQDKTVVVARLVKSSSDIDKEQYTTHSGYLGSNGEVSAAVKMNIQPASPEMTALAEGVYGKTFSAFTSSSGVVEGMRLTVSGTSQNYIVRGREVHDNGILPKHYELLLTKGGR